MTEVNHIAFGIFDCRCSAHAMAHAKTRHRHMCGPLFGTRGIAFLHFNYLRKRPSTDDSDHFGNARRTVG